MSDRIVSHVRSANPEGNLEPGRAYVVGETVSESRARALVDAGQAEWVDGPAETATEPTPEETATTEETETATEPQPSGPGGEVEVTQNGSWYTIYVGGEVVDKVQGADARDAALEELE